MNTLYLEALESLGNARELAVNEANQIMLDFNESFPFISSGNGKINWEFIKNKLELGSINDIKKQEAYSSSDKCLVIWNDIQYPLIETTLENVINSFDDVTAVSFDTWIFIPSSNNVIESIFGSLKATNNISW